MADDTSIELDWLKKAQGDKRTFRAMICGLAKRLLYNKCISQELQ